MTSSEMFGKDGQSSPTNDSPLAPGVRWREVFGWALYDFANSGYSTVVLTAVYNVFFVGVIARGAPWATLLWTATLATASLLALLLAPPLGAWADTHGRKKRLLAISTFGCIIGTTALAWPGQGDLLSACLFLILSSVCFSLGEGAIAAFLPELARPVSLGRLSGWGWSFGYFGGMLTLGLALAWVLHAQGQDIAPAVYVPQTMLIVALVFGLACIPTFIFLRERPGPHCKNGDGSLNVSLASQLGMSWNRVVRTAKAVREFQDFFNLLICAVFYQAGIAVVIALAAVYAESVMKFSMTQTMILVFVVNIAAACGAFVFGHVQDQIGHRRALALTICGWIAMVLIVATTSSLNAFWAAAALAGLCMGSSQSCGRALAGLFAPPERVAEFFGLWTMAVRIASIIGPLSYGLVTWATGGNHRLAILSTGVFFAIGLLLLARVDVERGSRAARSVH